jgi:hypothetical protein
VFIGVMSSHSQSSMYFEPDVARFNSLAGIVRLKFWLFF